MTDSAPEAHCSTTSTWPAIESHKDIAQDLKKPICQSCPLIKEVSGRALTRLQWDYVIGHEDEIDNLRTASLHWLRHTSETFDAPLR